VFSSRFRWSIRPTLLLLRQNGVHITVTKKPFSINFFTLLFPFFILPSKPLTLDLIETVSFSLQDPQRLQVILCTVNVPNFGHKGNFRHYENFGLLHLESF
jgi:hypothetical protein